MILFYKKRKRIIIIMYILIKDLNQIELQVHVDILERINIF